MARRTTMGQKIAAAAAIVVSILALLLWGKLKLVTGVLRSAYADPKIFARPARPVPPAPPAWKPRATPPAPVAPSNRPDLKGD